jgi:hypothetical protein
MARARGGRALRRALAVTAAVVLPVAPAAVPSSATASPGAPMIAASPAGASLLVTFGEPVAPSVARMALDALGDVVPVTPEAGVWSVTTPASATLRSRALALQGVVAAEWALRRSTDERPPRASQRTRTPAAPPLALTPVAVPTDTYYADQRQWALFPPATTWGSDLTGTPPRPRIAILDSGVDVTHPEWTGPATPLVRPWSAWTGREEANDWGRTGHGTHVAGSAAAPVNGLGVVGAAPGAAGTAEVIPVQISDRDGYSTDVTLMQGIRWAVANGAKVINISAGGVGDAVAFQRVIDWAYTSGALTVASVGNDGQDYGVVNYPAGYGNVLGVAAQCSGRAGTDCPQAYGLARFSNRNRSVDVVAPGVDIVSSVPPRVTPGAIAPGYAVKEGTSMAAPFVAGVAALVFAANPGATPFQVMRQIQNTATDMGAPGRDLSTGAGLINPRAAVTLPLPPNDPFESNADVREARSAKALTASRPSTVVEAYIDVDNDPTDVYALGLRSGQRVRLVLRSTGATARMSLWAPGTRSITGRQKPAATRGASTQGTLTYVPTRAGRWYVSIQATGGRSAYRLEVGR